MYKAKKSLVNSGYNPSKVEIASEKLSGVVSPSSNIRKTSQIENTGVIPSPKATSKNIPQISRTAIKKDSKYLIILIILLILISISSTILGLFWNRLFG